MKLHDRRKFDKGTTTQPYHREPAPHLLELPRYQNDTPLGPLVCSGKTATSTSDFMGDWLILFYKRECEGGLAKCTLATLDNFALQS